jgi:hypothetical protein
MRDGPEGLGSQAHLTEIGGHKAPHPTIKEENVKTIIRSTDHGRRLPLTEVEAKKRKIRAQYLAAGLHYLEYKGLLGSAPLGEAIVEEVTIIEAIAEVNYV